jgi:hypothetical protein
LSWSVKIASIALMNVLSTGLSLSLARTAWNAGPVRKTPCGSSRTVYSQLSPFIQYF